MYQTRVRVKFNDVFKKTVKTVGDINGSTDRIGYAVSKRLQTRAQMLAPRKSGKLQAGITLTRLGKGSFLIEASALRAKRSMEDRHAGFDYARVVEGEPLGRMRLWRPFEPRQFLYTALLQTEKDLRRFAEMEIEQTIEKNA